MHLQIINIKLSENDIIKILNSLNKHKEYVLQTKYDINYKYNS